MLLKLVHQLHAEPCALYEREVSIQIHISMSGRHIKTDHSHGIRKERKHVQHQHNSFGCTKSCNTVLLPQVPFSFLRQFSCTSIFFSDHNQWFHHAIEHILPDKYITIFIKFYTLQLPVLTICN